MFKNITRFLLGSVLLATLTISLFASNGDKPQKKASPFLITDNLPHLTKLVKQQWDNPTLDLSKKQKKKLLVVRKETMSKAQALGKKIAPLEKEVSEGIFNGKSPKDLKTTVQTI